MQRSLRLLVVAFLHVAIWCHHGNAQNVTVWQSKEPNDWFARQNWSLGVPNLELSAIIPDGVVSATSLRATASAANLTIGQRDERPSVAQLDVSGTSLNVLNVLDVARTNGGNVTGILTTKRGVGEQGNVGFGEVMNVGVASAGFAARTNSTVNAQVDIGGSLVPRRGSSTTLRVGSLADSGSVEASMKVARDILGGQSGFLNVAVGSIEQGGAGFVDARLETNNLIGNGEGQLVIGTNFGQGNAMGHVEVRNDLSGFQFVQVGDGGRGGSADATLVVGGVLDAQNVDVGSKLGFAHGQLDFLPDATFKGSRLTVHQRGGVSLPRELSGLVENLGQLAIPDFPGVPSVVRIDGSFRQAAGGVTTFDVRDFEPEFGYDRLEINGQAELGGRFDIRFSDDFKADVGEFEFIVGPSDNSAANVRLVNPPQDLAVAPDFRDGFRLNLVKPEPLEFINSGDKNLLLFDPKLWNGVTPESFHQVKLFNDDPTFSQTVTAFGSSVQSMVVGGLGGIDMFVPSGELLNVTHDLTVESGSTFALPNSQLFTSQLTLGKGSVFEQAGGTVVGNVLNAGRINVGAEETRRLVIDGDFVQDRTGLIELDLVNEEIFDQLVIDGAADLDGGLLINLPENFKLEPGAELPLIRANGGLADLDIHIRGLERFDDFNLGFKEEEGTVTLFSISADLSSLGDMNADGVKDETDILAFSMALTDLSAYIMSDLSEGVHPLAPGDLNFDNELDLDDIEPFLACLEVDICLPEFEIVPEPSSLRHSLCLCLLVVFWLRRTQLH